MNPVYERAIAMQERRFGVGMDYLRTLAGASPAAFAKFAMFAPLATHRTVLPPLPWHLARIAATQAADCGVCVQITVNAARLDGVAIDCIRHVLDGHPHDLPRDAALAARFGRAVAEDAPDLADAVADVAAHFGEAGHVELALAVASALVFPQLKRGLGLAVACDLDGIAIPGEVR